MKDVCLPFPNERHRARNGMNRDDVILEIREKYRQAGRSFNEFERRNWAAAEAMRLGWGGISLVSHALRMSPNTIKKGIAEIATGEAQLYSPSSGRIRKSGGGRKSKDEVRLEVGQQRTENVPEIPHSEAQGTDLVDAGRRETSNISADEGTSERQQLA